MQPTWGPGPEAHREEVQALVAEGIFVLARTRSDAPKAPASWAATFGTAREDTVHAGSGRIQRTVTGETLLGPPEEPRPQGAGASWKADQQGS